MKYAVCIIILLFCGSANSTAFTFGDGATWKSICSGVHDELDKEGAQASCMMFLMGFQAGAVEQSKITNTSPHFYKNFNPNTLPQEFVAFVNSNKKYEKMDVLDVLIEFFCSE